MSGSTNDWYDNEIYLSDARGEIQIDTRGTPGEIAEEVGKQDGTSRLLELVRGLSDKLARAEKEEQRRKGAPAVARTPPKPNPTVVTPPPVESPPIEDLPLLQGAPDLPVPDGQALALKTDGQSSYPLVSREAASHIAADQLHPLPAQEVAALVSPPPATAQDFDTLVQRTLRNEPEPGAPHPTHAGPAARRPAATADPIELFTGAFTSTAVDLVVPTPHIPIALSRSYRSGRAYYGPFGFGWDHSYNVYLRELNNGDFALWTGQLQEQHFHDVGGRFESTPGFAARLERMAGLNDVFWVRFPGGLEWKFERPSGWGDTQRIPLIIIRDRHGNTVRLSYDADERLASVLDAAGRGLLFQYGSCELLERVMDHTGSRVVSYWHDNEIEHLIRVVLPETAQYPNGLATNYEYDSYNPHPAMQHNILRIYDANDRLMVENDFAGPEAGWEFNAVVRQRVAGFEYEFEYQQIQYVWPDPEYVDVLASRTLVRPPDGSLHTYTFNYRGDLLDHRFRLVRDGSFRVIVSQWQHDTEGNVTAVTGPDGLRKFFTYDTGNADPCARRNLLRIELAAPLSGIVTSRVLYQGQYEPLYQLVTRTEEENGAQTRFFYDLDVNPASATGRLTRVELPGVVDADGAPQQSIMVFEHNAQGQLTASVRPEGGRTELTYISGGLHDGFLTQLTEALATANLVSTFAYDAAGFLAQAIAPGGRVTRFGHNALGQVEKVVAPEVDGLTATTHSWFDDSGALIRCERPAGSAAAIIAPELSIVDEYVRDEVGNIRSATLAANTNVARKWLQCVDHEGRPFSFWDATGTRTDLSFGENGALLCETVAAGDAEAQQTTYAYDRAGRVTHKFGPWKEETLFHYDGWGRLDSVTLPSGAVRAFVLGANDRLLEERVEENAPSGGAPPRLLQLQTFEYDKRGRLQSTTVSSFRDDPAIAAKLKTRYFYDRDDNLRLLILPRGAQHRFDFGPLGRLEATTDSFGNVRQYTYDASGDLTEIKSTETENGVARATTRFNTYDARGRLTQSEYLGTVARFRFDDRNLLLEQRATTGVTSRLEHDALGQVTERLIDPGGLSLRARFEYDPNGRLTRYIDPTAQATTWERDVLGRAVTIKPPDGSTWEYNIDDLARTVEQRMPSGNRVVLAYAQDANRPIKMVCIAAPGQEPVAPHDIVYDGLGRLVRASIGALVVVRQYDSLGRLIEETTRGQSVRTEYDDATGATDLIFPDGRKERTTHNVSGQPISTVLVTPGTLGGIAGDILLDIVYSTAGRAVRMRYGNGVECQVLYDDLGRVIRLEYQKEGLVLDSCRLRYDEEGHRALVQYPAPPAYNRIHRFDKNNRLVEARQGFPLVQLPDVTAPAAQVSDVAAANLAATGAQGAAFGLDNADVRTKITGLNGAANETYVSTSDHRVIAAGSGTITYNADGHRLADGRYKYTLDALNRVQKVRDRTTNAVLAELHYDALSRVATGATNGQPFERWFAGTTRIHEATGPSPGVTQQFSPHPLWPTPYCVVDPSGTAFIHQDEGWSTLCLTDSAGAVLERHRYDVFGTVATFSADGVTPLAALRTEPRWRGMLTLGTTTLYSTPQRLYDPETGVFTSRDPLLYVDSPSPYAFTAHNPVDFADPSGLAKSPIQQTGYSIAPLPPVSGGGLRHGFAWTQYEGAVGDTLNPDNPLWLRLGLGALAVLAAPLAAAEEAFPTVGNLGISAGEHLARGYLLGERGEYAEASADWLEAAANFALGFLNLASPAEAEISARPGGRQPLGTQSTQARPRLGAGGVAVETVDPVLEAAAHLREGEQFPPNLRGVRWKAGDPVTYPANGKYPRWRVVQRRIVENAKRAGNPLPLDPISPHRGTVPIDHIVPQRTGALDPHNPAKLWICDDWGWLEHAFFDPYAKGADSVGRRWAK